MYMHMYMYMYMYMYIYINNCRYWQFGAILWLTCKYYCFNSVDPFIFFPLKQRKKTPYRIRFSQDSLSFPGLVRSSDHLLAFYYGRNISETKHCQLMLYQPTASHFTLYYRKQFRDRLWMFWVCLALLPFPPFSFKQISSQWGIVLISCHGYCSSLDIQ